MVTMKGLYDTLPRRIRQNTLILSTRRLYSPKRWDTCARKLTNKISFLFFALKFHHLGA